jgi:hypothetical protein
MTNDVPQLEALTRFPFVARWGNADENDPRREYDRKAWRKIVTRLLDTPVQAGKESNEHGQSMRDLITSRASVKEAGGRSVVIGELEFQNTPGGWRWTTIFTEELEPVEAPSAVAISPTSPVYRLMLKAVTKHTAMKKELRIVALKRAGVWGYMEGQESGSGRAFCALLERTGFDEKGRMVWTLREVRFGSDGAAWRQAVAKHADVPESIVRAADKNGGSR